MRLIISTGTKEFGISWDGERWLDVKGEPMTVVEVSTLGDLLELIRQYGEFKIFGALDNASERIDN